MSNRSSWFGSPLSSSQSQSGSTMSLNGGKQHGYSSSKPKEPRPQRATMIAGAIGQGIREAILVTEEDISVLKSSLETLSLQSQQVIWHCSLCPYFSLIWWLLVDLMFVEKKSVIVVERDTHLTDCFNWIETRDPSFMLAALSQLFIFFSPHLSFSVFPYSNEHVTVARTYLWPWKGKHSERQWLTISTICYFRLATRNR